MSSGNSGRADRDLPGGRPEALGHRPGGGSAGLRRQVHSYLRRTKSLEERIPWLYLEGERYVHLWADGIYCNARLTNDRPCLLVIMGATEKGEKERVAVHDGERMLQAIWQSATKSEADKAIEAFLEAYQATYPRAVDCPVKDREALLRIHDFPAKHGVHIRTTNPIDSTFATVRLRSVRTKGSGSRSACLAMVCKLARSAEVQWRLLNASDLLGDVLRGVRFVDGERSGAA